MQFGQLKRREFITLLGGAAAWPLAAHAQQGEQMRRLGVLVSTLAADDPEWQARGNAFVQGLQERGWSDGRNVRIEYRWGLGDANRLRKYAAELVALAPDVILAAGSPAVGAVATIKFFCASRVRECHRPSRWRLCRHEIERGIAAFAHAPNGGLIAGGNATGFMSVEFGLSVVTSGGTAFHRNLITSLAARHQLPAVYPFRYYSTAGGLISFGPNTIEPIRRGASYTDRILKGEKPADLPVQAPVKYELVINLKTARALGLDVPATLLARADEVIE